MIKEVLQTDYYSVVTDNRTQPFPYSFGASGMFDNVQDAVKVAQEWREKGMTSRVWHYVISEVDFE